MKVTSFEDHSLTDANMFADNNPMCCTPGPSFSFRNVST